MFKRITWFSVGAVAGFGASKWVERKARKRLARYMPAAQLEAGMEAAARAREAAADKVADLRHAIEGGRDAMTAREAQLRRQLRLEALGKSPGRSRGKSPASNPADSPPKSPVERLPLRGQVGQSRGTART